MNDSAEKYHPYKKYKDPHLSKQIDYLFYKNYSWQHKLIKPQAQMISSLKLWQTKL